MAARDVLHSDSFSTRDVLSSFVSRTRLASIVSYPSPNHATPTYTSDFPLASFYQSMLVLHSVNWNDSRVTTLTSLKQVNWVNAKCHLLDCQVITGIIGIINYSWVWDLCGFVLYFSFVAFISDCTDFSRCSLQHQILWFSEYNS